MLRRAAEDSRLTAAAYAALIFYIDRSDENGESFPSYGKTAEDTGRDRSTVIRATNLLAGRGYLERIGRHNGKGNSSNIFRLVFRRQGVPAAIQKEYLKKPRRNARRQGSGAGQQQQASFINSDTGAKDADATFSKASESRIGATSDVASLPLNRVARMPSITPPSESSHSNQETSDRFCDAEGSQCEPVKNAKQREGAKGQKPENTADQAKRPLLQPGTMRSSHPQLPADLSDKERQLSRRYHAAIANGDQTEIDQVLRELETLETKQDTENEQD